MGTVSARITLRSFWLLPYLSNHIHFSVSIPTLFPPITFPSFQPVFSLLWFISFLMPLLPVVILNAFSHLSLFPTYYSHFRTTISPSPQLQHLVHHSISFSFIFFPEPLLITLNLLLSIQIFPINHTTTLAPHSLHFPQPLSLIISFFTII